MNDYGMNDKELIAALIMVIASLLDEKGEAFDMQTLRAYIRKYNNHERADLIDLWVGSERGRIVLKRHLIDKIPTERISEEIDRSPRQTARIIKQAGEELFVHI